MAAPTQTITCADCGQPYETKRANARICAICRLFRDISYVGNKKSTCIMCEKAFCRTTRGQLLCPSCDPNGSSLYSEGACNFCQAPHTKRIRADVAICLDCAHAPEHRVNVMKSLARKVAGRRELGAVA